MEYTLQTPKGENRTYTYNPSELVAEYNSICSMSVEQFRLNISKVLHYSVFACYIFNIPSKDVCSDQGLLHQLIHLVDIPDEPLVQASEIQQLFATTIKPYLKEL